MRDIRVGIIGFGTVGAGVVDCLLTNGELIANRTDMRPVVTRIADMDITTDRGVAVDPTLLTTDADAVVGADDIDVVVELVGGTTTAKTFILRALANGKPVVTANKALLADCGDEIFAAAEVSSADVYYEASVAGGIPIIKAMREGLVGNRITEIVGILNGTCNYILTRMEQESTSFDEVLGQAQAAGYAETPPDLDIDGIDTAHKATILASLAYGEWFGMEPLYVEGIRGLALRDIQYAANLGYRVKLLAVIKQCGADVQIRVHPTLIPHGSSLSHVHGVNNAVWVQGTPVGGTMYYGPGAGRDATASAVVADIVDVGLNLKFGSHRRVPAFRAHQGCAGVVPMADVETRYYLRLQVRNRAGVLAQIAGVLGESSISIASVHQQEIHGETAPLVILTYEAREANMQHAPVEIRELQVVSEDPVLIRIEDMP
ncbi:MAG: homoserine dehydrogenase [Candidatus Pacebacteria bacterium]|nr:homoserine dehydrogenase [Candidatus Paceibacterota bacterium]